MDASAHKSSFLTALRVRSPLTLNPYDILKCAAILLMLCDHIGAYLFPYDEIWRVIGRLCVPIWLFLIGYARSRRIDAPLVLAAAFLTTLHYFVQHEFNALNILWTIILLRLTLNPLMRWIGSSENRLYFITFAFVPLAIITRFAFEYGTMAYIFGIWGYISRNGFTDREGNPHKDMPLVYGLLAVALYGAIETMAFEFNPWHITLLVTGLILVYLGLAFYLPSGITTGSKLPAFLRGGMAFLARHTLGFYVIHLTILLLIYAILCHCTAACLCMPFGIDPTSLLL